MEVNDILIYILSFEIGQYEDREETIKIVTIDPNQLNSAFIDIDRPDYWYTVYFNIWLNGNKISGYFKRYWLESGKIKSGNWEQNFGKEININNYIKE